MDHRCGPPRQGACSARDQVQDQAADCAGADPRGAAGGRCSRCGADGCELRNNSILRHALTELGLTYVAAILPTVKVRPVREDEGTSVTTQPYLPLSASAASAPSRATPRSI